jgi:uncharacterized Rmd1/YagE family protein
MTTLGILAGLDHIRARAISVGERLDVRTLENTSRLAPQVPLCITAGERGVAVLFRYGVLVLFNVAPLEEGALLDQLRPFIGEPFEKPDIEEQDVRLAVDGVDGVEGGILKVGTFSVERLQLIAEILARSAALSRYEARVKESIAANESWAQHIERGNKSRRLEKQLLQNLGSTIVIQSSMTGRIEIDDKPEILWERADLERIYLRLEDEYELKERDRVLERKLALISSTADILLNLVSTKQGHRLEWYIIILIAMEIVITLTTLAFGLNH